MGDANHLRRVRRPWLLLTLAGLCVAAAFACAMVFGTGASLGEVWFRLSSGSLNLTQAFIQRWIWPPLWDPGLQTVLLRPAWAAFACLAIMFAGLAWWRSRTN